MVYMIEAFWASIAHFWGAWYRHQDYYLQINQLRGVLSLEPADGLSEARLMSWACTAGYPCFRMKAVNWDSVRCY